MKITIPGELMDQIHAHGEDSYPDEGAGLMLGQDDGETRSVKSLLPLDNAREGTSRRTRYLITAEDMLAGEKEAERMGLSILGIFHSHPDHPNQPSEFDRENAIPWYSYLITSIQGGKATSSKSWRLQENRSGFIEEEIILTN